MNTGQIIIAPARRADIPILAKMIAESFDSDRHTQMKQLGKTPYDLEKVFLLDLPRYIDSEKSVLIKAVDEGGEILGFCAWGFRGLERAEIPFLKKKREVNVSNPLGYQKNEIEDTGEKGGADETKEESKFETQRAPEDDPIKRLEEMTDQNMKKWMKKLMPDGTRCIFVISLAVSPKHQRQGVSSALLKWGTDVADERRIFIWVHSSGAAVSAYSKAGFKPIGTLDVDLDEYAPRSPPEEVGGEKWGHYIFTYIKYSSEK